MTPTPAPATVYRIGDVPYLYVRTERRSGDERPQHLFVRVDKSVVFQHWTDTVPLEAELIIDREGRKQADAEKWLRLAAEHEIEILVGLLKKACAMLPRERANELRREYADSRPPKAS